MSTQDDHGEPKKARKSPQATNEPSLHCMLHKLWTACVGTPGYNKEAWKDIEQQLQPLMNSHVTEPNVQNARQRYPLVAGLQDPDKIGRYYEDGCVYVGWADSKESLASIGSYLPLNLQLGDLFAAAIRGLHADCCALDDKPNGDTE